MKTAIAIFALAAIVVIGLNQSPATLRSGERDVLTALRIIRSALNEYFAETAKYPEGLDELVRDRDQRKVRKAYLRSIPNLWQVSPETIFPARVPKHHPMSDGVINYPNLISQDSGKWGYVNNPKDKEFGTIFIDCTHTDSKGTAWNSY